MSPLLQSRCLKGCAITVPRQASELLNDCLGCKGLVHESQLYRLIHTYGEHAHLEKSLRTPLQEQGEKSAPHTNPAHKVLYAMLDGGMLAYDGGYREVKVGRVFDGACVVSQQADAHRVNQRKEIQHSEYIVREGHYEAFAAAFSELIDAHRAQKPDHDLVIISDGAAWMQDWVAERYAQSTHILDFYHAYEHLCEFGQVAWPDLAAREAKLSAWKTLLLESGVGHIIQEVETYCSDSRPAVADAAEGLLTYLNDKRHRMDYATYRKKGYMIGSGAIESAIRCVVQQRCKLSGQRWSNGAQAVLNIRCLYSSGKWSTMNKIIANHYANAA